MIPGRPLDGCTQIRRDLPRRSRSILDSLGAGPIRRLGALTAEHLVNHSAQGGSFPLRTSPARNLIVS